MVLPVALLRSLRSSLQRTLGESGMNRIQVKSAAKDIAGKLQKGVGDAEAIEHIVKPRR